MKLSKYKEEFYEFSGKASDNARTYALAGIGIIWVFRITTGGVPLIPKALLVPLAFFAAALALDLIHYVVASITWGLFQRIQEAKLDDPSVEDPELSHPVLLTYPIWALFVLKLAAVLTGYGFVASHIWTSWFSQTAT